MRLCWNPNVAWALMLHGSRRLRLSCGRTFRISSQRQLRCVIEVLVRNASTSNGPRPLLEFPVML